jgi:hypothetical protein
MTTVVLQVPTDLQDFLARQVAAKGFQDSAEYLLYLLRQAKSAQTNIATDQQFLDDIGLPGSSMGGHRTSAQEDDFDETIRD